MNAQLSPVNLFRFAMSNVARRPVTARTSVGFARSRIPSDERGVRRVQPDLIPADIIWPMEVKKSVTPDNDGDAVSTSHNTEAKMAEVPLIAVMLQWEMRFLMEEAGVTTRAESRQHVLNSARFYFGSRFAKKLVAKKETSAWEGTAMMEVASPIIDALDEDFLADYFDRIKVAPLPAD